MAEDFAQAASRFCRAIDQRPNRSLALWLRDVEIALAGVYASAVALPDVGPATKEPLPRMSHEEWASLYEELRERLGDRDSYGIVLGVAHEESVVAASLADDLADVYRELRAGLEATTSGAPPEDVLFEWRTSFDMHWADHAVGALGAIRRILRRLEEEAP